MSLECPHKIAKKDGHLHETAQKDGRLPYLVILCRHTVVVRVSLGECWVRYLQNIVSSKMSRLCPTLGGFALSFHGHVPQLPMVPRKVPMIRFGRAMVGSLVGGVK